MNREYTENGSGNKLAEAISYERFEAELIKLLAERYGETVLLIPRDVAREGGVLRHGLTFEEEGRPISPTFYLESWYEKRRAGIPMEEIGQMIAEEYEERKKEIPQLTHSIFTREGFLDGLRMKLINSEQNAAELVRAPWRRFFDLAALPYLELHGEGRRFPHMTLRVQETDLQRLELSPDEVWKTAWENTLRSDPPEFEHISHYLEEAGYSSYAYRRAGSEGEAAQPEDAPLYVLTRESGYLGAALVMEEHLLQRAARKMRADLFILPSSVHEVLLLADEGQYEVDELMHQVAQVNETIVNKAEVLSGHIYYYSRSGILSDLTTGETMPAEDLPPRR